MDDVTPHATRDSFLCVACFEDFFDMAVIDFGPYVTYYVESGRFSNSSISHNSYDANRSLQLPQVFQNSFVQLEDTTFFVVLDEDSSRLSFSNCGEIERRKKCYDSVQST